MFTKTLAFCLLSFFLFFQPAAQEWKEYTSREGKFTVMLPGEPRTVSMMIGQDSPASVTYIADLQTPAVAYTLAYFDILEPLTESEKIDQLLDETRDRIINIHWHTPPAQPSLKLTDVPGGATKINTYK